MDGGHDSDSNIQQHDSDDDDEVDTIMSSYFVAKQSNTKENTKLLAKMDHCHGVTDTDSLMATGRAAQGPSCRSVLFSNCLRYPGPSRMRTRRESANYTNCPTTKTLNALGMIPVPFHL